MSYGTPPPPPPPGYGAPTPAPMSGDPGTLDLPWYGIGFTDAIRRFFQKYTRFDGRASRSEYWWVFLANILVSIVIEVINFAISNTLGTVLSLVVFLATVVPGIAVAARRLHDGGFSGWLLLLALIPCVGTIAVIVLLCLPPKPEGVKYDRNSGGPAGGPYGGQPGGQPGYGSPYSK